MILTLTVEQLRTIQKRITQTNPTWNAGIKTEAHTLLAANHPVITAGNDRAVDTAKQDPAALTTQTKTILLRVSQLLTATVCPHCQTLALWSGRSQTAERSEPLHGYTTQYIFTGGLGAELASAWITWHFLKELTGIDAGLREAEKTTRILVDSTVLCL